MKILIVDDNPDYRRILSDTFSDKGWEVVDAPDGSHGLKMIVEERPDVVLSDVLMPRMDGFQFLREVRKSDHRGVIFIFYTSAYEKQTHEEFGLSLGADAYIIKPLDPDDIFSTLQELLEGGKTRPFRNELPSEEEFLRRHNVILSESLYEKVLELRKECEQRRRAEAELERLKRRYGGAVGEDDGSGFVACPFAVSEDLYAPVEKIAETCGLLLEKSAVAGEQGTKETLQKILALTGRMKSLLQDLLRFSLLPREEVLAPARMVSALLGSLSASPKGDLQPLRSDLEAMAREVGTYTCYVDDLLRAATAYNSPVKKTSVDLSEMAREIERELRQGAPQRGGNFLVREKMTAIADGRLMRLALKELLDNAWKFSSRKETPRIEFGTTTIRNKSVFFVRDNGAGFDMKCADALFTAFRRLHSKEEFPGDGIGLVIVKGVIVRHGGTVWAIGEPEGGATFYFTLYRM